MPSSQILPLLWIGDEYAANPPEVHAFGYILNITIEVDKCSILSEDTTIFFQRFPIFDYGGEKQQQAMFDFFSDACAIIQQGMAAGRQVLVHCVEGKQRSCAVVAAYLIMTMGFTIAQAKDYIVQKRPEAFDSGAHVNFAPALEHWEKTVMSSMKEEETVKKEISSRLAGSSKASKGRLSNVHKTKKK